MWVGRISFASYASCSSDSSDSRGGLDEGLLSRMRVVFRRREHSICSQFFVFMQYNER